MTYDRLDESLKTPQLKQIVKNIQLTNDYIYEFEQKIESEPNEKTKQNLESLRKLLKNQEKEFFSIVMKIKKPTMKNESKKCNYRNCGATLPEGTHGRRDYCDEKCKYKETRERIKENVRPEKPSRERFKEVSKAQGGKNLTNEEFLEMVRVWTEYKKNKGQDLKPQEPFNDTGFDLLPKYPVPERFKSRLRVFVESSAYVLGMHIAQLLAFYFIVAACLWDLNPGNWNAYLRYGLIIVSYLFTNTVLAFGHKIDKFLK